MSYLGSACAALIGAGCASSAENGSTPGNPQTANDASSEGSGSTSSGSSSGGGSSGSTGSSGGTGSSGSTGSSGGSTSSGGTGSSGSGSSGSSGSASSSGSSGSSGGAPPGKYDWLQFEFGPDKMGVNSAEATVSAANVVKLTQLFQVPNSDPPDGAPVALSGVTTPMGVKDLVYVLGQHGLLTAFDGTTGATVWHVTFAATGYGNSAPAIDPNRQFIYVNTADNLIHKVQVGDGTEVKGGGWPIPTGSGKPSGQLTIGTDNGGVSYLYASNNGSGHVTVVNLATGTTHVFNLACADQPDTQTPAACDRGANPWARAPVFLPDLQKVFVGTGTNDGSGKWIPGKVWRTSWVALPPDGHTTMMAGGGFPLDSYTPANWAGIVGGDRDSSVGGLIPLPTGYSAKVPHLAIQPGKDGVIRVLNLDDMSGKGSAGNLGGEVLMLGAPLGLMRSWGAIWVNPADKVAWCFVGGSGGLGAYTVNLDANGIPTLTQKWVKTIGWTAAPFVANGVLYASGGAGERTGGSATHPLDALDPATGNVLWTANVGPHHWSSPIMVNGILYMADGHSGGCDVANGSPTCTPQGPGNVTAWSIK